MSVAVFLFWSEFLKPKSTFAYCLHVLRMVLGSVCFTLLISFYFKNWFRIIISGF